MNKYIKEIHENTNKQWKEMKLIVLDLNVVRESINTMQTKGYQRKKI